MTVVPDNLAIPGKVLSGEFDVMMTDNVEAMLFAARMPGLSAVNPDTPFTKEDFGYLLPRDDTPLLAWLNLWLHQARAKNHYTTWQATWISHKNRTHTHLSDVAKLYKYKQLHASSPMIVSIRN